MLKSHNAATRKNSRVTDVTRFIFLHHESEKKKWQFFDGAEEEKREKKKEKKKKKKEKKKEKREKKKEKRGKERGGKNRKKNQKRR